MSFLLICPPQKTVYGPPALPRLGMAYLSAALRANDIEHAVIDLGLYPDDWQSVLRPRLKRHASFGITATSFEFHSACRTAEFIKCHSPSAPIILGGAHATLLGPGILSEHKAFDYCLTGEGEEILPRLVMHAEKNAGTAADIPGVCFRQVGGVRSGACARIEALDTLPFPAFDLFELHKYTDAPKTLPILTSRGCPYGCIYCSVGLVMGRQFRPRSPENILAEIRHDMETFGTRSFSINDDNLTFDIERAKAICRGILDSRLRISWNASNGIRVNHLDEELVSLMKASGCREIAVGVESVNDKVLQALHKGASVNTIENAIRLIKKHRILLKGFFLIGSPQETPADTRASLEFALKHCDTSRFSMLTPYPGTRLWQWVEENHYWTVAEPLKEIGNFTHIGAAATMFETPCFRQAEKEAVYRDVYRRLGEREKQSTAARLFSQVRGLLRQLKRTRGPCPPRQKPGRPPGAEDAPVPCDISSRKKWRRSGSLERTGGMIRSRDDLKACLLADGVTSRNRLKDVCGNDIQRFLILLRKAEYFTNCAKGPCGRLLARFYRFRLQRRGLRLGFTIPINVFGPGLSIAYPGTIAVSPIARVGANCRLHTCVNIGTFGNPPGAPRIGDNVYIAPGAKLYGGIEIADGIAVGANAVVNRSFLEKGITIAGAPARKINSRGAAGLGLLPKGEHMPSDPVSARPDPAPAAVFAQRAGRGAQTKPEPPCVESADN